MTISNSHARLVAVSVFGVGLIVAIVMMVLTQKVKAASSEPPPLPRIYYACDTESGTPTCKKVPENTPNAYDGPVACQEVCGKYFCDWSSKSGYTGNCTDTKPREASTTLSILQTECDTICPNANQVANQWGICDKDDGFEYCECSSYEDGVCNPPTGKNGCSKMLPNQCKKYCCCGTNGKITNAFYSSNPDKSKCKHVDDATTTCSVSDYNPNCNLPPPPPHKGMYWYRREGNSQDGYVCNAIQADYPADGNVSCDPPPQSGNSGWCNDPQIVCGGTPQLWYVSAKPSDVSSLLTPSPSLNKNKQYCFYYVGDKAPSSINKNDWAHTKDGGCPSTSAYLKNVWINSPRGKLDGCSECPDLSTLGNCQLHNYVDASGPGFADPTSCGTALCKPYKYVPSSETGGWGTCLPTFHECTCVTDGQTKWEKDNSCGPDQLYVDGKCMDICMSCDGKKRKGCSSPYQFKCMDDSCASTNNSASACVVTDSSKSCMCRLPKVPDGSDCSTHPFVASCGTAVGCNTSGCVGCKVKQESNYTPVACKAPPTAKLPSGTATPNCVLKPSSGEYAANMWVCPTDLSECLVSDDKVYDQLKSMTTNPTHNWFVCKNDPKTSCKMLSDVNKTCEEDSANCCRLFPTLFVEGERPDDNCIKCWQGTTKSCDYCKKG